MTERKGNKPKGDKSDTLGEQLATHHGFIEFCKHQAEANITNRRVVKKWQEDVLNGVGFFSRNRDLKKKAAIDAIRGVDAEIVAMHDIQRILEDSTEIYFTEDIKSWHLTAVGHRRLLRVGVQAGEYYCVKTDYDVKSLMGDGELTTQARAARLVVFPTFFSVQNLSRQILGRSK